MSDITAFIDAIYDRFEKSIYDAEDDQKLPPKPVLTEVCQELLNVSCMREEGRFPSFRVCFIDPDSELLDTYIYSHVLKFDQPIPFSTRNLHKLAPALNADMSYLMLDITAAPYKIIGIIASYTAWEKIMTRELTSGNRMPRIPNILVSGPGELKTCFGEYLVQSFLADLLIHSPGTRHQPRHDIVGFLTSFHQRGEGAEILDTSVGTGPEEDIIHLRTEQFLSGLETHIVKSFQETLFR